MPLSRGRIPTDNRGSGSFGPTNSPVGSAPDFGPSSGQIALSDQGGSGGAIFGQSSPQPFRTGQFNPSTDRFRFNPERFSQVQRPESFGRSPFGRQASGDRQRDPFGNSIGLKPTPTEIGGSRNNLFQTERSKPPASSGSRHQRLFDILDDQNQGNELLGRLQSAQQQATNNPRRAQFMERVMQFARSQGLI